MGSNHLTRLILVLLISVVVGVFPTITSAEDDRDDYTIKEKVALKKFRLANASILKVYEYMQNDPYLIGWLRASHLDIDRATDMFHKNLEWRKENNLDHILEEEFPMFEKNYPVLYAQDRKGRPVLLLPVGAWDVRKAVVSGHRDEFERFLKQLFEKCFSFSKVRDGFANRNVSQMTAILDLAGYNLRQHACAGCIQIYINMIMNYERYYPQGMHKMIGVNTPSIFNALLEILKPFMSAHTRNALSFHGFNREEWRKIILEEIAPDQLPLQYGGTKRIVTNY